VIGIDFGNDKCVVSLIRGGELKIVTNDLAMRKTASMVAYGDERRFIGETAVGQQLSNASNTITDFKRLLGKSFSAPSVQKDAAGHVFKIVAGENDRAMVQVNYRGEKTILSPESISAALFSQLKTLSESFCGGAACNECVISVPPHFTDAQRRALIDAGRLSGFNVLGLINETTAVALQYGLLRKLPSDKSIKVLFYDFGHSQLNVSLVDLKDGEMKVLASASDPDLGGRDFDDVILYILLDQIQKKYKLDARESKKAYLRLKRESEKIKKALSANRDTVYSMDCLMEDTDVSGTLDRATFEAAAAGLLGRILNPVHAVLSKTGLKPEELDAVEVVGGAIRIPAVMNTLEGSFGSVLKKTCDGDESVARGCALQAAMLSPKIRVMDFKVVDCTMYPLSVIHGSPNLPPEGPATDFFVEFNSIPCVKAISFPREDSLEMILGYSDTAAVPPGTSPSIAKFVIEGRKAGNDTEGKPKMKVKVTMDHSGIICPASAQFFETVVIPETSEPVSEKDSTASDSKPSAGSEVKKDVPASEDKTDDAMDVDHAVDAPTSGEDNKPKTKKKTRKSDLSVQTILTNSLSSETFNAYFELECSMANQDRLVAETLARKNDLESYIYEIRDRVEFELVDYIQPGDKDKFLSKLSETEEWLYGDGSFAQKSQYISLLQDLRAVGDAVISRHFEESHREAAVLEFKKGVYALQKEIQDTAKYAHINLADVSKVINDADQWLFGKLGEQSKLTKTDNPAVTVAEIQSKASELEKACKKILSTPKPASAPAPESEKKDSKPKEGERESADASKTAMDVDSAEAPAAEGDKMNVD